MTDSSTQGIKTVLHPVSDLATAKAVYAALLGVSPQTDEPYYVGFDTAGQHIGLVPGGGSQGMTSPVAFDPRALAAPYRWFRISARRIQAGREGNELPDRELMRNSRWLA
jgi:hypothetical protein